MILVLDCYKIIYSYLDMCEGTEVIDCFKLTDKEKKDVLDYWMSNTKIEIVIEPQSKIWLMNGKKNIE